jgi:hypothetical protein
MRRETNQLFDKGQNFSRAVSTLQKPRGGRSSVIMPPMQFLRNTHLIARFVLVWFALSIGVAIASPIVKPQAMELICSGAGGMKLLAKSTDGSPKVTGHTLDCPLCVAIGAPPPVAVLVSEPLQALGVVRQCVATEHIASLSAAPLPARGPPAVL